MRFETRAAAGVRSGARAVAAAALAVAFGCAGARAREEARVEASPPMIAPAPRGSSPTSSPIARPAETAIQAAQRYAALVKARRPREAIEAMLDLDLHLRRIFGEDWDRASAADRAEMRRLIERLFDAMYADPNLVDAMAAARYENFRELAPHNPAAAAAGGAEDGLTIVAFDTVLGEQRVTNRLFLSPVAGQWRIVDLSGGGASVAISLRAQYLAHRDRTTPVQFMRELASVGPELHGASKP